MNNYAAKYEEYKQSILHNRKLRNELRDKYNGSLYAEKDYIDGNGVLLKVGVLHQVCGVCLVFFSSLDGRTDTFGIIVRIVIAIVGIACFLWALHIGNKFKRNLGEKIFYSFRYHQHFKDHVQKEKREETYSLMRDMWKSYHALLWRIDDFQTMTKEDLESFLFRHIKEMGDYEKRYEELEKYDRFTSDLKNDYYFNDEIQENIDKYI